MENSNQPILRLVLKSYYKRARDCLNNMYEKVTSKDYSATLGERHDGINTDKILDDIFKKLSEIVEEQGAYVKEKMKHMTPEQKEQLFKIYQEVMQLFNFLLDKIMDFFRSVVIEIKSGKKINKKKMQEFFDCIFQDISRNFEKIEQYSMNKTLVDEQLPVSTKTGQIDSKS